MKACESQIKGVKARSAKAARLAALAAGLASWGLCAAQSLPPMPKAASPSKSGKAEPAPPIPAAELPLVAPGPKDLPKAPKACSELPEKGLDWMVEALGAIQAQSLRPNGSPKARDAYAELWSFFLSSRAKGYDMDSFSGKVEALYVGLYPPGPFAPASPFEKFKEPRKPCARKASGDPPPSDKP